MLFVNMTEEYSCRRQSCPRKWRVLPLGFRAGHHEFSSKFSKSWKVLISKYFLGSASLLAVSSPPDFDTNNLIEKSGREQGQKKNRKREKEKYLFQQTATKWKSGRGVQREDDVLLVWGDFKAKPVKQSPPNRWLIYSFKHF